ncbi:hypothetical protein MKW92_053390, partial [Papaver armeniacum]
MAGISGAKRDNFGVYAMQGKPLNVRDASTRKLRRNREIKDIKKILGLEENKEYGDEESLKSLRYGRVMIMADQ